MNCEKSTLDNIKLSSVLLQSRRQGTSIRGVFDFKGGHKSRCVFVCVLGGERAICDHVESMQLLSYAVLSVSLS